ncbi:MAPK kinase substrate protein [Frankliniella fusca]|uniref:MAPK kinase substrate protein n=1 Tax=Frankliniella fusca TaxID=407009 RepID=A0AAE1GZ12_9NEOP|nr:MAPK kinase substrate protein [Frankliniella fusca]
MDSDEDEFEVEESAPVQVAMSPELATSVRGPLHPAQPRAVDDMDIGWSSGFSDNVFDSGDADDKADMESEVEAADFDHNMDDGGGDDEGHAEQRDDGDDDAEQDHAASEVNGAGAGHPMLIGKGPAERMLQRGRGRSGGADHDHDVGEVSPPLSAILAVTPPSPHPAAFGAKDPDRLESGRKAPVVVEFGHERKGYTVTREREQKKWR